MRRTVFRHAVRVEPVLPSSPPPTRFPPARRLLLPLALALAAIAAYANSFRVPLLLDDVASIAENPSIRKLWPLGPVLTPPANVGLGGRPVANLSFAFNYALSGPRVTGYHVTNLLIHIAAGLVLFDLLRRTLRLPLRAASRSASAATPIAFTVALLWLVHPLQTESVTYLSQRTESLMGLWYLLTVWCFARGVSENRVQWFAGATIACAFGMATKEVMVTAPVIVLLYDRTFVAGSFRRAWQLRRSVHLALAATWLVLLFLLVDVHERGVGYATVSAWEYALAECRAILLYLKLALWPDPLVFDYGSGMLRDTGAAWPHAGATALLVVATIVALWRAPRAGFTMACVFILLSPTSSVVPVAGQPIAEHRMYLPLAALLSVVVIALHHRFGRAALAIGGVAALAAGIATFARNATYASAQRLWADTAEKAPDNPRAHASLGAALLEARQLEPAVNALRRTLALEPAFAEAHNNLAAALIDLGRPAEAVPHFAAALQLRPGTASTHYNFGNLLLQLGRPAEAIAQQEQAIILKPQFPEAECALANALAAAGRIDEATAHYEKALRLAPGLVPAHFGLATVLVHAGRGAEAVKHYEATLRAVPTSVEAHYQFGNLLFALRQMNDALRHYEAAIQLKPDLAEAHNNAGNALAMLGRPAEAIPRYEAALRLQPGLEAARTNLAAVRQAAGAR